MPNYTVIITWICVAVFAGTVVLAFAGLLNVVRLGRKPEQHDGYVKLLFGSLLLEVVIACVAVFVQTSHRSERLEQVRLFALTELATDVANLQYPQKEQAEKAARAARSLSAYCLVSNDPYVAKNLPAIIIELGKIEDKAIATQWDKGAAASAMAALKTLTPLLKEGN